MVFVPNVMVGLTGKNKDGSRWVETKETYDNTMAFFKRNQDIISHFNIGVLAAETGTELQKQLDDWQEVDTDEATMNRSWIKNKDVHEKYYYDLSKMGLEQLEDPNVSAYIDAVMELDVEKAAEPIPLFTKPLRDFRKKLLADVKTGAKKKMEKVAAYDGWQWDVGDRVYGKKTDAIYEIIARTWDDKNNRPMYMYKGLGSKEGQQGNFIAELAHDDLTLMTGPRLVGDTEVYAGGHGTLKVSKEEADFVDDFNLGNTHVNSLVLDAYRIATGNTENTIGPDTTFKGLRGWESELVDELEWNRDDAVEFIDDVIDRAKKATGVVGESEVLFDIEISENEGKYGTATGSLLYWNISKIAKDAGGWNKIKAYLKTIKQWNGIPITSKSINYIGNKGTELSKNAKLRNKVKAVETFRDRLSAGEIDENSKEYAAAVKKYGSDLQLFTVSRSKRFYVGTDTIYGPKQKGDITKTVKKEHSFLGPFKTELTRDKNFKLVMDTPIFSKNLETRRKEIDAIIKKNKQYAGWYEDWNSFIKAFKNLPEDKLVKYIKLMAVFSAQSGPQGNMKEFTRFVNKLEVGQEIKVGKKKDGADGIDQDQYNKIMAIWNDADPATTLEERRDAYGDKVGTYMHVGLFPHADGVVIDRHMPRLWGYDITWSPNMKFKNFNIMPQVELEIVGDIKEAAARNNISPSAVQATLWYESRIPDVVASSYRMAAAMSPSEYLPGVMHAGLRTESLGVGKHFKQTPLKKGDFLLATKRDGTIKHNSYSRDDIGKRIADHTDANPYAELVYLYEAGTDPENQLKGKPNVYEVDLNQEKIYDGITDTLGYWEFARQRLALDPFANLTNIFANLIKKTGLFDGMVVKAPVGEGRWILLFDKAEITGVPEDAVAGVSDVVKTLESNFPQTIKGISAIFNGRADKLYKKFKSLKAKYAEIKEDYFKPTVARFQGATGGKHEISGMAGIRGPLKAVRAMLAEFGVANIQNNIILVHTEEGAKRNGSFYRFKVKRSFESVEQIYRAIAKYGLEDYNISVNPIAGSFFIEQFVMDSYPQSFVDSFTKMIGDITDKGFPQNTTYRATSEVLGDPNWTGVPARALKFYKQDLIDYFGQKEGMEKYAKAIKAAQIYKGEIRKQIDSRKPGEDLSDFEEGREGRPADYGRAVKGPDVAGQFANPDLDMPDVEETPTESKADIYYSQLRAAVDSKSFPEKSSAKNYISVLEGMVKKGHIKAIELDWVGLIEWLEYNKGPMTKAKVLDFLEKNNVKIDEVIFGQDATASEAGRRHAADLILDEYIGSNNYTEDGWGELAAELELWVMEGGDVSDYADVHSFFGYNVDLVSWMQEATAEEGETEYTQYTVDEEGSPEYKEILITGYQSPQQLFAGAMEALDWYYKKEYKDDQYYKSFKNLDNEQKGRLLRKLALYKLQKAKAPAYLVTQFKKWQNSGAYQIPHWQGKGVEDVVAHLRFDEKTIDGKRTLFIEEIQSDWAQRGRKVGFIDYKKYAPVGYHFIKQIQPDKSYVVHQLVDDATGKVIAEGSMRGETLVKAGFKSGFVKQTPFRMSKDWALLVLKRAVRYAAENGYEQIAWTGGDIQVKRYENAFRKAVDEIYYNKKTGHLRGVKGGAIVFEKTLGSDAELPDYVGAANAKQLLSAKMHNEGRLKELTKKKIELYKDLKEWFKLNTEARIHEQILPMLYPGMLDYENIDWRMKGAEYADIYSYVKQSGVRMKYGKFKKELHALEAVNDFLEDGESVVGGDNIIMDSQGMKGFYDEIVPSAFKKFFGSKKKPKKKWGKPELKMQDMVVTDNVESARYVSPHYIPVAGNDHVMSGSRIAIFRNGYWREQSLAEAVQLLDSNELYNESDYDLGMMGADIKAAVIDWVQDKEIPQDYDSIADYSRDVIVPALNQRLGTTEEANKIWVSPITSEMREKATTEGFPLFDIEESEIPTKTSTVLTDKIGRKQKKLSDKIAESFRDFLDNWQTNMVDKLHPIKDWFGEKSNAYMLFRGLPGIQSTLNAFMEHGKLKMLSDGAITTEGNGQGFIPWLNGLGKDAEKFLYWQIAKRSEVLTGEDREMLLTDADRKKIYDWVGEKPENRDSWQEISDEFAEWNDNMLDMALGAGLITKEQVKGWQTEYYIPFYRIFEDEATRMEFVRGPAKGKKFISANIKRLRGSEKRMGDPMENIIKNWSALLTNSMSNTASREMFNFAADNNLKTGLIKINEETGEEEEIPLIEQIPWSKTVIFKPTGKGGPVFVQEKTGEPILAFKDGGKSVFYKVNDPELYGALSGLNKEYFNNVLMSVMSGSKRLLTLGATITPAFRIANMLRDTLHTFQISENFIPFWDTARGFMKIWNNDPEYAEFMASGHAFGGSYVRADDPNALKKYTDRLVQKEGKGAIKTLLDTTAKLWGFWEDIGEASENAARVQLYSNLKKKGVSHLEASFSARDLMDFQMSGASNVVQFFIQTVPFLNARVQGLYKMGRALADNPKTFMAKGAMISVASLALWLLYSDDDRYKELEDWEKWAYYHFWIGGVHFRIPKPFETGVIFSSSVEAAANVMSGNDEIDHVFGYLKHAMLETFAFNPVPQVIRPVAEVYMDKSFFTGRPIESPSKKRLRPGDRYDPWDSETLRLLGDKLNISPKKAKTLIRGYTASIGMGILAVSDLMVRNIADFPERPSVSIEQYPGIGRFVRGKVSRYTKHMSKFYDLYKEVDELVGTVNNYKRIGEFEKARDLTKANRRKLGMRKGLGAARKQLGNISLEMRKVWYSRTLKSSEKNARLEDLTLQRNKIVKQIYDRYLNK